MKKVLAAFLTAIVSISLVLSIHVPGVVFGAETENAQAGLNADCAMLYLDVLNQNTGPVVFYDVTGDGQEDMLVMDGNSPSNYQIYSVLSDAQSGQLRAQEILSVNYQGLHETLISYTDDKYLVVSTANFGMFSYHEYAYTEGSFQEVGSGDAMMGGTMMDPVWEYSVNGIPTTMEDFFYYYSGRPGVVLVSVEASSLNPSPYMMNYTDAQGFLQQIVASGSVQPQEIQGTGTSPELQGTVTEFLHKLTGAMGLNIVTEIQDTAIASGYIGGFNPDKEIDTMHLLGQLTNGQILGRMLECMPSFIIPITGMEGADNYVIENDSLLWIVENMFNIDLDTYEKYKAEVSGQGNQNIVFHYTPVSYREEVYYAPIFGWGMCETNTYITNIQQTNNILNVDFEYYNSDLGFGAEIYHCHAILEQREENGEAYLSLRLLEAEVTDSGLVRQVQEILNGMGYDCGGADGSAGPATIAAVNAYQRDHNMTETSYISTGLVDVLTGVADVPENSVQPEESPVQTEEETFEDIW